MKATDEDPFLTRKRRRNIDRTTADVLHFPTVELLEAENDITN